MTRVLLLSVRQSNSGGPNNQMAVEREPADQVSWWELSGLAERDPEAVAKVWERVKAEASDELSSGMRAAEVVEWDTSPSSGVQPQSPVRLMPEVRQRRPYPQTLGVELRN